MGTIISYLVFSVFSWNTKILCESYFPSPLKFNLNYRSIGNFSERWENFGINSGIFFAKEEEYNTWSFYSYATIFVNKETEIKIGAVPVPFGTVNLTLSPLSYSFPRNNLFYNKIIPAPWSEWGVLLSRSINFRKVYPHFTIGVIDGFGTDLDIKKAGDIKNVTGLWAVIARLGKVSEHSEINLSGYLGKRDTSHHFGMVDGYFKFISEYLEIGGEWIGALPWFKGSFPQAIEVALYSAPRLKKGRNPPTPPMLIHAWGYGYSSFIGFKLPYNTKLGVIFERLRIYNLEILKSQEIEIEDKSRISMNISIRGGKWLFQIGYAISLSKEEYGNVLSTTTVFGL